MAGFAGDGLNFFSLFFSFPIYRFLGRPFALDGKTGDARRRHWRPVPRRRKNDEAEWEHFKESECTRSQFACSFIFSKNSLLFVCSCFLRVGIHSSSSLSSLHFFSKVDDYSPPTASRRQKHRPLLQTPLTLSLSLSLPPYHHALRRLNCVFKVCFKLAHDTKYPKFFFYTIYTYIKLRWSCLFSSFSLPPFLSRDSFLLFFIFLYLSRIA